jgi:hypothetical protein
MTPEEEQKYRAEVRAELQKKEDIKLKAKIKTEEEAKMQGGSTVIIAKKLWKLAMGK